MSAKTMRAELVELLKAGRVYYNPADQAYRVRSAGRGSGYTAAATPEQALELRFLYSAGLIRPLAQAKGIVLERVELTSGAAAAHDVEREQQLLSLLHQQHALAESLARELAACKGCLPVEGYAVIGEGGRMTMKAYRDTLRSLDLPEQAVSHE